MKNWELIIVNTSNIKKDFRAKLMKMVTKKLQEMNAIWDLIMNLLKI